MCAPRRFIVGASWNWCVDVALRRDYVWVVMVLSVVAGPAVEDEDPVVVLVAL